MDRAAASPWARRLPAKYASPRSTCLAKRVEAKAKKPLPVGPEAPALRFLDKHGGDWCTSPEKKAMNVCKEVLKEDGWRGSPLIACQQQLLHIASGVHERQAWHDSEASEQLKAREAYSCTGSCTATQSHANPCKSGTH